MSPSRLVVLQKWQQTELSYQPLRERVRSFISTASLVGTQMIQDVPTRIEYMRMIRAEANHVLEMARTAPEQVKILFDHISARRNELRLIAQDKAKASIKVLSKLLTKNRSKYELLVRAANTLAEEGKLPAVKVGKEIRSIPLEKLNPEQLDDVFLKAIDKAGGSRKSITPIKMKMRGAGLLLLTVALAGLDIYLSQDKSFATSKNASSIVGGAGGAWALAAAGLAIGGPVGGVIGLVLGGIAGSFVAEEVHYQIRGLNVAPGINQLVARYNNLLGFDEDALGVAIHEQFVADLQSVYVCFAHLNEKRNADVDEVALAYLKVAREVIQKYPDGALTDGFHSPVGQALAKLLYVALDEGWTTGEEYRYLEWLTQISSTPASL
jgi:hypothetical protein